MNATSTAERPDAVERRLGPEPTSVGEARRLVRELLVTGDRDDLVETASLLVSEVVTNAVLHAGTPIDVAARLGGDGLRVEVSDGSTHLPVRRRYGTTAGTGRGMVMLEQFVEEWGVVPHEGGKTVWFRLADPASSEHPAELQTEDAPRRTDEVVAVDLENVPLLLHGAWQEHAESLLREYLLASLDEESDADPIQVHAAATDAIAILAEQIPAADVALEPDQLMSDATEPLVTAPHLTIEVPVESVEHFAVLDEAIEESLELAQHGRFMTPPTQPEMQAFRRWMCGQVVGQATGGPAVRWSAEGELASPPTFDLAWDPSLVDRAATAVIAADESNRIVSVSEGALALLGYEDKRELVGRRLVAVVPPRYRQAHVAGFTMFLLVGRDPLVGRPVEVPALRRDGSEVRVQMLLTVERLGDGHTLFVADITPVDG